MVSLVQAAAAISVFLVVHSAGVLADMVDRRRLLLFTQRWMIVAAVALEVPDVFELASLWMLLVFTFVMGLGAVMNDPPGGSDHPRGGFLHLHATLRRWPFDFLRAWMLREAVGPALAVSL